MPSANHTETPIAVDLDVLEARFSELDDYTVSFEHYKQDFDLSPLLRGLPDDRCQSAHWGFVRSGELTFRWADRDETYRAGDAYYAPPGHAPSMTAGTEIVEFSPTKDLQETVAVVEANFAATSV
jgi:hypothetical protein